MITKLNQILKYSFNNGYHKSNILLNFLNKNKFSYKITKNNYIVITSEISRYIKNWFFDSLNIGDIVFIPKKEDLWNTKEKRYTIIRKFIDNTNNYCVEFNDTFDTYKIINICYIEIDIKVQRRLKLKRITNLISI